MVQENAFPRVSVKPEEDARLPILEAQIEREWRRWRKSYVKLLLKEGRFETQVRETALWCIQVMNQYEERGLNPDQGREAARELIFPEH